MDVNDIDVAHHEYPDFCQIYQPTEVFPFAGEWDKLQEVI